MPTDKYTVELHIGKDVLASCASHVEENTAYRQAKRLELAGEPIGAIVRIWFQKRLIYKTND